MHLRQLRLLSFKNHPDRRFDFQGDLLAFCGKNGVGKTNVLDAIYLLCMCKSYFHTIDANAINHDEPFYSVHGKLEKDGKHEVAIMYKRNEGKTFKFDKKTYERLSDHIGKMPVVFITPGDIGLINEGSEERRRFMDAILCQTDSRYLNELIRYQRALDQRNRLLKVFRTKGFVDKPLLDSLNAGLTAPAPYLYEKRIAFMEEFCVSFKEHHAALTENEEVSDIRYQSDLNEASLAELLDAQYKADIEATRSTKGLHKDELLFTLHGFPLKKFGSQGQIKTFLIALKLAQFDYLKEKTGQKPFLLLDDIFEKLDAFRAERLIQMVAKEHFGQIFLTDTHRERVESIFSEIGRKAEIFVLE